MIFSAHLAKKFTFIFFEPLFVFCFSFFVCLKVFSFVFLIVVFVEFFVTLFTKRLKFQQPFWKFLKRFFFFTTTTFFNWTLPGELNSRLPKWKLGFLPLEDGKLEAGERIELSSMVNETMLWPLQSNLLKISCLPTSFFCSFYRF